MKIAMIGCGAAGSVFASYLRRGGADIVLVDPYKAHLDKIKESGMDFTIHQLTDHGYEDIKCHLTGFETAYSADEIAPVDIAVFLTKTTQLESAVQGAKHCIGENTVVCTLLNGLGNEEVLNKYYPAERVLFGSGAIGTALNGLAACTGTPPVETGINIGMLAESELNRAAGKYLEACFNNGGASCILRNDVRPFVWKKVISNSAVNTVCALLRLNIGNVYNDKFGREIFYKVISEGCSVARAYGVDVDTDEFFNGYMHSIFTDCADLYTSMCQDMLMNGRQTEVESLNGAIARYAERAGISTPVDSLLTQMVHCIESNYDKQYFKH